MTGVEWRAFGNGLRIQMTFKKPIEWALCLLVLSSVYTFTPEILELNHRIGELQHRNRELSALRNNISAPQSLPPPPTSSPHLTKYSTSQVKFNTRCSHTGHSLSAFLFQTVSNVYFAINYPQHNSVRFYSHRCEQLSAIDGLQIKEVLCDRGVCQSGTLHFLGRDQCLYSAIEDKNFTTATRLANLEGARTVGGVIRNRGKDKIEIYLSSEDGVVRVFDESGVAKLRIELDGFNSRIVAVRDHHPYPILVMQSNWISMLDTTKYAEIAPNCPHIPDIRHVLAENYYGEAAYVITSNRVYLLDFQISKKNCLIKRKYELEVPLASADSVSFFSNTIFIDNRVFNLTEKRMYVLDEMCLQASLAFLYKKSQGEEIYALKQCCAPSECTVEFYQIKKINEDRSILFWLTIAFIAILFLSISFMKKSTINNLDLDDPAKMREREVQQQIMALSQQAKNSKDKKPPLKTNKKQN